MQYYSTLRKCIWAYTTPQGKHTYVLIDLFLVAENFGALCTEHNNNLITKWLSEGSQDVLTWEQCEKLAQSLPEADPAGKEYWEASEAIIDMTTPPYHSDHVRGL